MDQAGEVVWEWYASSMEIEQYPICPLCKRHEFAHANSCAPMPNGDIMVSFRVLNLLVVVDRWSDEITWQHHDPDFGHQHDCHLLENGNVLVYANGFHANEVNFSRAIEFEFASGAPVWEYRGKPTLRFSARISAAPKGCAPATP